MCVCACVCALADISSKKLITLVETVKETAMGGSRRLLILYGSQTGTAQDTAERLGRQAKQRWFSVRVFSLDAYPIVSLLLWSCLERGGLDNMSDRCVPFGFVPAGILNFWNFVAMILC